VPLSSQVGSRGTFQGLEKDLLPHLNQVLCSSRLKTAFDGLVPAARQTVNTYDS
jgi:hypothetical protein